ncbi:MAG: ATP-binding protein [Acidimicrobiales bacterium]
MIVFVGGLIGAGKSSVARQLADRLGYYYFDLDEIKRDIYGRDPDNKRKLVEGIPIDLTTRGEVYRTAIAELETLISAHPNVVFDDTLHFRQFRRMLYVAVTDMGQDFIMVWVRASESTILTRLAAAPRLNHVLSDPVPLHLQMVRDFEEFSHCLVMCPNDGALDDTLDDLCSLLGRVGSLELPVGASGADCQ